MCGGILDIGTIGGYFWIWDFGFWILCGYNEDAIWKSKTIFFPI